MTIMNTTISGGGNAPVINALNVTPSTSAQTITASSGVDGYSPVNVSAVTSAIDANIIAGNIKKDVEILGVTGSYEGQAPTGTMYIISNGTYNVADKAIANVQVPTTAPAHYVEKVIDGNGVLQNSTNIINLNGVGSIGDYVLYGQYYHVTFPANTTANLSGLAAINGYNACSYMFDTCSGLTSVDLSDLTAIGGANACDRMFNSCAGLRTVDLSSLTTISGSNACYYMFRGCTGLTSVDLSGLTTINGSGACQYMFYNCTGLTNISLSSLTTISSPSGCSYMFQGCTGLTSVDLSGLTTISGNGACASMFQGCTWLTAVKISALNTMSVQIASSYGQMFTGCTRLESVEFGGLTASTFASRTDQIAYLFKNDTGSVASNGCTVHFPSNFDPSDPNHTFDASTLTGYPTFGGNASYIHVAFDLPATE